MSKTRGRGERSEGRRRARPGPGGARARRTPEPARQDDDTVEIFGIHAVAAALANPARDVRDIWLTQNAENRLVSALAGRGVAPQRVLPKALDRRLGAETVHQGALLGCSALAVAELDALAEAAVHNKRPLVFLDQVTDPHNVGAVLRSCAVFGAAGLVMTRRHSPPLAGATAKAASGALELVPVALVQNLVQAIAALTAQRFRVIGLDGAGEAAFEAALDGGPTAIVLGAEGKGLRQSTAAACSLTARLATDGAIASLNVSNAAAIALYTHVLMRNGGLAGR